MAVIKVLIVDDSELIRSLLSEIFAADKDIVVVGVAVDAFEARDKIKQLNPDVLTLDVEMPGMDGITFLKNLMRLRPMPVVMISTLTENGADTTLQAMEFGAVDYIAKPKMYVENGLLVLAEDICAKVKQAARANVVALEHSIRQKQLASPLHAWPASQLTNNFSIVAIGASTGGTEAIKQVLSDLPAHMPPIVMVQHMPEGFTASFARRLNSLLGLSVEEFCNPGQILENNHVYLANGANHMVVRKEQGLLKAYIAELEPVNRHKPSVDVLFDSVSESCGCNALGVLLTGMGNDGARGLGRMLAAGATTVAQNEESSVVWGMPRAAILQGAVKEVLPLDQIGRFIADKCYGH
jgi:two-component system chemotaxis response regulator CheB